MGRRFILSNSREYQREACCRFIYVVVCVYIMFILFNDAYLLPCVLWETSPFLCLRAGSDVEIQNTIPAHCCLQQTEHFASNVLLNNMPCLPYAKQIHDLGILLAYGLRQAYCLYSHSLFFCCTDF